jgi:hypothetical protein
MNILSQGKSKIAQAAEWPMFSQISWGLYAYIEGNHDSAEPKHPTDAPLSLSLLCPSDNCFMW